MESMSWGSRAKMAILPPDELQGPNLTAALKPLKRTDVTQLVVDRLRTLLEQGVLRPGSKLPPEPEMSKLLGISRPSLRQAYKALSLLGILRAVPGDGTYISDSTSDILSVPLTFLMLMKRIGLNEIFEFRMMLEASLAQLAASRASDEEIQEMTAEIDSMAQGLRDGDSDRYRTSEYAFHNSIAKAAHNHLLLEVIHIVGGILWEARRALHNLVTDLDDDLAQHRAILDGVAQHDPQEAASAMRRHLESALELARNKAVI